MEKFFAYIRVSTAKQGEKGVSLQEQKDAITRYTQRYSLEISQWFEERETAAKRGRPVFTQMLRLLRQKRARGVIIHKIDRSARNLKDWADLGEKIDAGVEVLPLKGSRSDSTFVLYAAPSCHCRPRRSPV